MKKAKKVCAKTQKINIFQNQGGKCPPSLPPQMTSLFAPATITTLQSTEWLNGRGVKAQTMHAPVPKQAI